MARIDRMFSFRAGAVFKPDEEGSIYAAYGTSLSPSLEGLSYGTANTAIDPEKTYTFEAGSKWELFKSRILLTGAVFRVEKTNARTPGLPGEPPQVLNGRQRVDGVELSASGRVVRGWQIFAGYTFLDSEIVKSNTALVNGIPRWARRSSTRRATPSASGRPTTRPGSWNWAAARASSADASATTSTRGQVEGYWLLDLMASYPLVGATSTCGSTSTT